MNNEHIDQLVRAAISAAQADGSLPTFDVGDLGIERPADATNGDWTTTVALRSAKLAHRAPRAIAQAIVDHLPESPSVERVEVAGPGFVNFYLKRAAANEVFLRVIREGSNFGRSDVGAGVRMQVEFVSANPVGPMHVGHGRWCALGDSLCRVLEHAGYGVEREFYINDHGSQMDVFGSSISCRYVQLGRLMEQRACDLASAYKVLAADLEAYITDEEDTSPELHPLTNEFREALGGNAYGGLYIVDIARDFWESDGDRFMVCDESTRMQEFRERAYLLMLENIRTTCHEARCDFDRWFSERSLYEKDEDGNDAVTRALAQLEAEGHLYTSEDGALWFRSTTFGDDKDRVVIKSNGEYTYFASDVAYHWDKFQRVDHVIDLWGADHHGYIKRVESVCSALGYPGQFEVLLGQLVNLLRAGHPVRMSKRRGTMITFDELLAEVGADAVRYTLISKSSNQAIDFDIEAAKRRALDNPVYYVQYAHARICSILRRAAGVGTAGTVEAAGSAAPVDDLLTSTQGEGSCVPRATQSSARSIDEIAASVVGKDVDLSLLVDPTEEALARKLSEFGDLVAGCARDRAPFRLTHYAEELAAQFHSFYSACSVLPGAGRDVSPELSAARLAVCDAVRRVLALTLSLIGVSAPLSM